MTTTPTFRVADGMLVENARESNPNIITPGKVRYDSMEHYIEACEQYTQHLASLRSIPIAPGVVLQGESLREGEDFRVDYDYSQGTGGIKYAYPVEKELGVDCFECGGLGVLDDKILCTTCAGTGTLHQPPTPPARAFSLAEALEICTDSLVQGMGLAKGKSLSKEFVATRYDLDAHLKTYFKQRFNIDI